MSAAATSSSTPGRGSLARRCLLSAGLIERVDRTDEQVFVGLTKEQIKSAPEFDEVRYVRQPGGRTH
jgi:hypothetical protein